MLKESEKKGNRRKYWGKAWVFMTFSLPALPTEEKAEKAINEMPSLPPAVATFEAQVVRRVHFPSSAASHRSEGKSGFTLSDSCVAVEMEVTPDIRVRKYRDRQKYASQVL